MAGMGFLADAYDLFVINIVLLMMKEVDYGEPLTHHYQAQVSMMAIVGALVGQVRGSCISTFIRSHHPLIQAL